MTSVTDKMTLCFSLYDLDEDGYLVPDELEQMLRAYMIGSAKLAAEAVDVMEIDFDEDFDEDNWDDVQSLLPSGGAAKALPEAGSGSVSLSASIASSCCDESTGATSSGRLTIDGAVAMM